MGNFIRLVSRPVLQLAVAFLPALGASAQTTPFPVALTIEEGRFPDVVGVTRTSTGLTFGVPFAAADAIKLVAGRVPVDLAGPGVLRWQATPFELEDPRDSSSSVCWAVIDAVLDRVEAGQARTDLTLVRGSGTSSGAPLLTTSGNTVTIDTGAARFLFKANGFAFLEEGWIGGVQIIEPSAQSGIQVEVDGERYSSRHGPSHVQVNRNGPACTQLDISGEIWNEARTKVLCSYVLSLTAYALATSLDGRLSLIAGHGQSRSDLLFDSARLVAQLVPSHVVPPYRATFTHESGSVTEDLAGCETLCSVQFQTSRTLEGETRSLYYPGLPKIDVAGANASRERILTGNRIVKRRCASHQDEVLHLNTDPTRFPLGLVGLATIADQQAGVSLLATHAATQFPVAVEFGGDGTCALKLWPDDKPRSYQGSRLYFAIPFRAAEAREFTLELWRGTAPDPVAFGLRHSEPLLARYTRFEDYGTALYREQGIPALSIEFQQELYRWMGLLSATESIADLVPDISWTPGVHGFEEVAYLEQNRTGGTYNQDFAERQLLDYLRFGRTGAWLRAASMVNYARTYQFHHHWPLGCDYLSPPTSTGYGWVTTRGDSDVEHDWWRSARLYARLTGSDLLRREFLDHSRIFPDANGQVMYYRFHVKSLEETALAYSLARHAYPPLPDDPCTGVAIADSLRTKLTTRLEDWFERRYDVSHPYESEGWVLGRGALLPNALANPWLSKNGFPYWGLGTYMDRGVRHDGCYACLDPTCRSVPSEPYGRRVFHEWLAGGSLALARSVLPVGDAIDLEAFLRLAQLGFSTMTILHWTGQPLPCASLPYLPAYAKTADASHVWLPPPCDDPGYAEDGPLQPREGDGHLGYPYVGEMARAVLLQYALTGDQPALEIACTKFHEVLAAQRFRMRYGDPCTQYTSFTNTHFDINIDEPGHWSFLADLARYGAVFVRADYPAFNPEARFYR